MVVMSPSVQIYSNNHIIIVQQAIKKAQRKFVLFLSYLFDITSFIDKKFTNIKIQKDL